MSSERPQGGEIPKDDVMAKNYGAFGASSVSSTMWRNREMIRAAFANIKFIDDDEEKWPLQQTKSNWMAVYEDTGLIEERARGEEIVASASENMSQEQRFEDGLAILIANPRRYFSGLKLLASTVAKAPTTEYLNRFLNVLTIGLDQAYFDEIPTGKPYLEISLDDVRKELINMANAVEVKDARFYAGKLYYLIRIILDK